MAEKKKLGLYIHIPFCRSKCDYCDFYSLPNPAPELMERYQKALLAHLEEMVLQTQGHEVDSLYFGGGTPSFYGETRLKALLKAVEKHYSMVRHCEITLEANPDSVDKAMLTHLRRAGVNRLSIGMQSACDRHLAELHRPHTFQQVKEAVEAARKAGLDNVSLDVIYGLPNQTMAQWQDTVEQAIALKPRHLSCYGLKIEEGTPLAARRSSVRIPDDDLQADEYLWMVKRLAGAGYRQYEISNFAQPGYESRHNLKYWNGGEYAGLGPGAHSDFGDRRYSYIRDVEGYIAGVLEGKPLLDESELIPRRERAGEYVMLRLRTVQGIEEAEYRREYRMNFQPLLEWLKVYQFHGWAVQENGRWRFTPEGFLRSNRLIGELLEAQEKTTLKSMMEYIGRESRGNGMP